MSENREKSFSHLLSPEIYIIIIFHFILLRVTLTSDDDLQGLDHLCRAVLSRQTVLSTVRPRHIFDDQDTQVAGLVHSQTTGWNDCVLTTQPLAGRGRFSGNQSLHSELGSGFGAHCLWHDNLWFHCRLGHENLTHYLGKLRAGAES